MPKSTFTAIAALAGVGTATVERVLNGRGGVRPATAEKVIAAARRLDYPKRLPEVHRGLLRIEVLLVRPEHTFFRRLSRAFERIGATLDPSVRVRRTFVDEADPSAIAARIDHPEIQAAAAAAARLLVTPDRLNPNAAEASPCPSSSSAPANAAPGRRWRCARAGMTAR